MISIEQLVGSHVSDLALLTTLQQCPALGDLDVPADWVIAQPPTGVASTRIALTGPLPDGGWKATETISAFCFTGTIPDPLIRKGSDCTLKALNADSITTYPLEARPGDGVVATRSNGYFTAADRRIWAQYSTYVACACGTGQGLLLVHVLAVDAVQRASLRFDVEDMSDAVHQAFLEHAATLERSVDLSADDERMA